MDVMNEHSLDPLIKAYRRCPLPTVPGHLEQNVWREIRLRSESVSDTSWQGFFDWILSRRLVGASLAAAMVMGVAFNFWPQPMTAREALGLGIFSHNHFSPLVEFAPSS